MCVISLLLFRDKKIAPIGAIFVSKIANYLSILLYLRCASPV
ncbi:hypothetical protein GCHA_4204 [Paraglaciecola chathamensis S18K6]|uniref:Uncharacterized protein n=1 Tax=Paraglaciecola chathamensis S18K6 TaxID=1127672 RepID=A0AAV3V5T5_9ALTE|nr:hypothetical protein GCHA_4204 [Paraglaciecola chathamensis S18K6]